MNFLIVDKEKIGKIESTTPLILANYKMIAGGHSMGRTMDTVNTSSQGSGQMPTRLNMPTLSFK
jgi:hypothetical protein